jgi:hypothetical protein
MSEPKRIKKINSKEEYNAYMNEYMKKKYHENAEKTKQYKNALNIKKKYIIPDEIAERYKEEIYNVVKIKELMSGLSKGSFERFLMEYRELEFPLREKPTSV